MNIDLALLEQLWVAGERVDEIGRRFGCCNKVIYQLVRQHKLPPRQNRSHRFHDPTPDEIEQRKAECRARHMADRLAEPPNAARKRAWYERQTAS